jgi:UDP-2,3-diacylglucosamine pyrophosphatase LpxH
MAGGFMKLYCASDLHIGYENSNHQKIKQFFNIVRENADELILCGDVFDLWRYPYDKMIGKQKSDFEDIMSDLKKTAAKVPTTIIPGNHDYDLLKLWKNYHEYHVSIADPFEKEKIYFCHGWNFDVMQRFGSFAYGWLVLAFPSIYQRFFKKPSEMLLRNDVESPETIATHNEANQYALKNQLKYVVMGHTHIPVIQDRIIDCGDFVDSTSYVILDSGVPELKFI